MTYQKPTNVEELHRGDCRSGTGIKIPERGNGGLCCPLYDNLKPINILKNALQPVSNGVIGKWAGKLILGYKKLLHKPDDTKKPFLISRY